MSVPEWIEKIGRTVLESPFGSGAADAPELAEIRLILVDAVRAKTQRVAGRQVFACNAVKLTVRGVSDSDAESWRSTFMQGVLERELRSSLTRAGVRFPEDLAVEVDSTPEFPSPGEEWISVELTGRRGETTEVSAGRLIVVQGTANVPEILIEKPRINIGRTVDVHRKDGPSRRNDLAFSDDSPTNRTVSREHAHIVFSASRREYRLFNDRVYSGANCGLWILRAGLSQAIHRDVRGVRLMGGDEIHLGSAVLRFELAAGDGRNG